MDKKRRSSMKKLDDPQSAHKRRISFSSRKSIRIFSKEEEPKTWDNSYDISDHSIKNGTQDASAKSQNENETSSQQLQQSSIQLNSTKDLINASNPSSNSLHLEHSVDITLLDREKNPSIKSNFKHMENLEEKSRSQLESYVIDDTENYILKNASAYAIRDNTLDILRDIERIKQNKKSHGDEDGIGPSAADDANKENDPQQLFKPANEDAPTAQQETMEDIVKSKLRSNANENNHKNCDSDANQPTTSQSTVNYQLKPKIAQCNVPSKLVVRKLFTPIKTLKPLHFKKSSQKMKSQPSQIPLPKPAATSETKDVIRDMSSFCEMLSMANDDDSVSTANSSSSPVLPAEFKGLKFKQLNDAIQNGNINVFSQAMKTPTKIERRNEETKTNKNNHPSSSVKNYFDFNMSGIEKPDIEMQNEMDFQFFSNKKSILLENTADFLIKSSGDDITFKTYADMELSNTLAEDKQKYFPCTLNPCETENHFIKDFSTSKDNIRKTIHFEAKDLDESRVDHQPQSIKKLEDNYCRKTINFTNAEIHNDSYDKLLKSHKKSEQIKDILNDCHNEQMENSFSTDINAKNQKELRTILDEAKIKTAYFTNTNANADDVMLLSKTIENHRADVNRRTLLQDNNEMMEITLDNVAFEKEINQRGGNAHSTNRPNWQHDVIDQTRKTIHFTNANDVLSETITNHEKVNLKDHFKINESMETSFRNESGAEPKFTHKTLHGELMMMENSIKAFSPISSNANNRKTIYFSKNSNDIFDNTNLPNKNNELKLCDQESNSNSKSQSSRKTIHFTNEIIDDCNIMQTTKNNNVNIINNLDDIDAMELSLVSSTLDNVDGEKNKHVDQLSFAAKISGLQEDNLGEIDNVNKNRKTIHFMSKDMDESTIEEYTEDSVPIIPNSNRRTIHFLNKNISEDKNTENFIKENIPERKNRKSIYAIEDIEIDEDTQNNVAVCSKKNTRTTILFTEENIRAEEKKDEIVKNQWDYDIQSIENNIRKSIHLQDMQMAEIEDSLKQHSQRKTQKFENETTEEMDILLKDDQHLSHKLKEQQNLRKIMFFGDKTIMDENEQQQQLQNKQRETMHFVNELMNTNEVTLKDDQTLKEMIKHHHRETLHYDTKITDEKEVSSKETQNVLEETRHFDCEIQEAGKEVSLMNDQQLKRQQISRKTLHFDNENQQNANEFSFINDQQHISRKTLHFGNEIENAEMEFSIKENQATIAEPQILGKNNHLGSEIQENKKEISLMNDQQLKQQHSSGKTLHFNNEIQENANQMSFINDQQLKQQNISRKTLHFNNEIEDDVDNDKNVVLKDEQKLKQQYISRKTLHFDNEILENEKEISFSNDQQLKQQNILRKTLHFNNKIQEDDKKDALKDDQQLNQQHILRKTLQFINKIEDDGMEVSFVDDQQLKRQHFPRKTLYYGNEIEVEGHEVVLKDDQELNHQNISRKTLHFGNDIQDIESEVSFKEDQHAIGELQILGNNRHFGSEIQEDAKHVSFVNDQQLKQQHIPRKTLYYDNEIEVDGKEVTLKDDQKLTHQNIYRKTLHFANDIKEIGSEISFKEDQHAIVERQSLGKNLQLVNENEDDGMEISFVDDQQLKQQHISRKTLYCGIEIEEDGKEVALKDDQELKHQNISRKTLHFGNDIQEIESEVSFKEDQHAIGELQILGKTTNFGSKLQMDKKEVSLINDQQLQQSHIPRKTLHFGNDIQEIGSEVSFKEDQLHFGYKIQMNENEGLLIKDQQFKHQQISRNFGNEIQEYTKEVSFKTDEFLANKMEEQHCPRKTLYFGNKIQEEDQQQQPHRKTIHFDNEIEEDENKDQQSKQSHIPRKTMHFDYEIEDDEMKTSIKDSHSSNKIGQQQQQFHERTIHFGNEILVDENVVSFKESKQIKQPHIIRKTINFGYEIKEDDDKKELSIKDDHFLGKTNKILDTNHQLNQSKAEQNDDIASMEISFNNKTCNVGKNLKQKENILNKPQNCMKLQDIHNFIETCDMIEEDDKPQKTAAADKTLSMDLTLGNNASSALHKEKPQRYMTPLNKGTKRDMLGITPRYSHIEFLKLEKRAERGSVDSECEKNSSPNCMSSKAAEYSKRLPNNLTPVMSMAKKRHTLKMDESAIEQQQHMQFQDLQNEDLSCIIVNPNASGIHRSSANFAAIAAKQDIQSSPKSTKSRASNIYEITIPDFDCDLMESIQMPRRLNSLANHNTDFKEDNNPITISDVSEYFHKTKTNCLSNINVSSEDCIENTSSPKILHRSDKSFDIPVQDELVVEDCTKLDESLRRATTMSDVTAETNNISRLCKKCKECKRRNSPELTTNSIHSVTLPKLPLINVDLSYLRELRKLPNLLDVNITWSRILKAPVVLPEEPETQEELQKAHIAYKPAKEIIAKYYRDLQR